MPKKYHLLEVKFLLGITYGLMQYPIIHSNSKLLNHLL
jgi:hypothetical protein